MSKQDLELQFKFELKGAELQIIFLLQIFSTNF